MDHGPNPSIEHSHTTNTTILRQRHVLIFMGLLQVDYLQLYNIGKMPESIQMLVDGMESFLSIRKGLQSAWKVSAGMRFLLLLRRRPAVARLVVGVARSRQLLTSSSVVFAYRRGGSPR